MATTFVGHFLGPGIHSSRPATTGLPEGTMYVCTTHNKIERVVSAAWVDYATLGSGLTVSTDTIWDSKGDLAAATGADTAAKLPVGSNGQVLTADSAQTAGVKWAAASGGAATDAIYDAKGDIVAASAADTAARLPVGGDGQILTADSTQTLGIKWSAAPSGGILATLFDAKGDLIAASANDTAARLPVGTDGQVLTADSAQTLGVKWAAAATGGGGDGWMRQRTGTANDRWYAAAVINGSNWSSVAQTVNRLYALPFIPAKNMTVDGMGFVVNGTAVGNTRLGIYSDDGNLYPATLLGQSSSLSTNSTAVVKDTTSFAVALTAGTLYWLTYVTSSSAAIRSPVAAGAIPILGADSTLSLTAPGYGWDASYTFGTLSTPYPAGAVVITTATFPAIFVRGT